MAHNDRVGELLSEIKRKTKEIVSPEGVPVRIEIAGKGERFGALALDLLIMGSAIFLIYMFLVVFILTGVNYTIGAAIVLFVAFVVRNMYFLHFELAWQGRTPGKKVCNLRVINRQGGELTPSAVVARNLMREIEIFLPLSALLSLTINSTLYGLALFGWLAIISAIPFFNKEHLRAGDIIAGTLVIAMPKRVLVSDLSTTAVKTVQSPYSFTPEQLSIYGNFELQVLEELLRHPDTPGERKLQQDVITKICTKIGWTKYIPPEMTRTFLSSFYTAQRAELERGQLFGRTREDKNQKKA